MMNTCTDSRNDQNLPLWCPKPVMTICNRICSNTPHEWVSHLCLCVHVCTYKYTRLPVYIERRSAFPVSSSQGGLDRKEIFTSTSMCTCQIILWWPRGPLVPFVSSGYALLMKSTRWARVMGSCAQCTDGTYMQSTQIGGTLHMHHPQDCKCKAYCRVQAVVQSLKIQSSHHFEEAKLKVLVEQLSTAKKNAETHCFRGENVYKMPSFFNLSYQHSRGILPVIDLPSLITHSEQLEPRCSRVGTSIVKSMVFPTTCTVEAGRDSSLQTLVSPAVSG